MFLRRTGQVAVRRLVNAPRPIQRGFATTFVRNGNQTGSTEKRVKRFNDVKGPEDLMGVGAEPGTVPTDLEQATGLERLEILGKMEGIDIFDMKPLDASRRSTIENPIVVKSYGEEQYLGCTGFPVDSHETIWLTVSKDRPIERCPECGQVYRMQYLGPEDTHDHGHGHGHDEHHPEPHKDPETMADYVKPEYIYQSVQTILGELRAWKGAG